MLNTNLTFCIYLFGILPSYIIRLQVARTNVPFFFSLRLLFIMALAIIYDVCVWYLLPQLIKKNATVHVFYRQKKWKNLNERNGEKEKFQKNTKFYLWILVFLLFKFDSSFDFLLFYILRYNFLFFLVSHSVSLPICVWSAQTIHLL